MAEVSGKKGISSGTFGSVAYDEYNPKIAIKNCGRDCFEASIKETSILSYLQHPNIIKPLSINYSYDGSCKIFMERYEGNLYGTAWLECAARIRKSPSTQLLRMVLELSSAVDYMHKCGIIHADLKPQNILFETVECGRYDNENSNGGYIQYKIRPIICDFNTSILEPLDTVYTRIQTLNYRAPEVNEKYPQSRDIYRCHINERIDIWSLGCIIYELFTGDLFMKPSNDGVPSWLAAAKAFKLPLDTTLVNNNWATGIKQMLFSMTSLDVESAVREMITSTEWKDRMKLSIKYGRKNEEISQSMLDLFVEIISGCLVPDPSCRRGSSDLFVFMRDTCADIIDLSMSAEIAIQPSSQLPRFRVGFFESIINDHLKQITVRSNDAVANNSVDGNIAHLHEFMRGYPSAHLLSKIIELKYYEKKKIKKLINDDGLHISLAACVLSGMLLEINDVCNEIKPYLNDTSQLMEITATLSGDFL